MRAKRITVFPGAVEDSILGDVADRMTAYVAPYAELLRYAGQQRHLGHVITGLTSNLERKSAEPIAIHHGLPRRVIQNFIGMSDWEWDGLCALQRAEVKREIGIPGGMLIIDGSAVPKKGTETVGVARQWCGRLGKVDSCVVGVHAVYVGLDGQAALVDSQLYLPEEEWAHNAAKREKVHVPGHVQFETKTEIAENILQRILREIPFAWVTADEEFGRSRAFRDAIRAANKFYVLEVPRDTMARAERRAGSRAALRVDAMIKTGGRKRQMKKILVAYGEKQPIIVHATQLAVMTGREGGAEVSETLLHTVDADGAEHFFLAHLPQGCGLATTVKRAHQRHRVEEVFGEAKGDVGMDHFECRSWHGWYHHMTLVQMAHWFLVREQRRMGKKMSRDHRQHAQTGHCQDPGASPDAGEHRRMAVVPALEERDLASAPLPSARLRRHAQAMGEQLESK